jgi:hypothetical protein
LVREPQLKGESTVEDDFESLHFAGFGEKLMDATDATEERSGVAEVGENQSMGLRVLAEDAGEEFESRHIVEEKIGDDGIARVLGEGFECGLGAPGIIDGPRGAPGGEVLAEVVQIARGTIDEENAPSHELGAWEG